MFMPLLCYADKEAMVWRWYGAGMVQGRTEISSMAQLEGFIALDDMVAVARVCLLSVAIL